MKTIVKLGLLTLITGAISLSSCTRNFEDINTDPNSPQPEAVQPQYLLTYVLNRSVLVVNQYQNQQTMNADEFAQFYANSLQQTQLAASNYKINDQYITGFWDNYNLYIAQLNTIIRNFSDQPRYTNSVQMARIWKCWMYQRLTDAFGDVAYFNASNGSAQPAAYDSQQSIYLDMLVVLKDAITKFSSDPVANVGSQDLVFNGDNAKWITFANTLRLRIAMRMSAIDPTTAKTEAEAAIAAGIISKNEDGAYVKFGATGSSGINPLAFNTGGMGMSTTMQNILTNLGGQPWPTGVTATVFPTMVDPRGPKMFNPSKGDKNGNYKNRWTGTYPGLTTANISLAINAPESNAIIGSMYKVNNKPFAILKYSETCFILAEAALKGWNAGGTAQSWYEKGIEASMAEYSIAPATVSAYIADATANVNGTTVSYTNTTGTNNTEMDKIMTQKWIALFPENSWEAWADFRRTNKPLLLTPQYVDPAYFQVPASNVSSNPKAFIQRLPYPQSEATTNTANYNTAIGKLGGAEFQIQDAVWWDPNK